MTSFTVTTYTRHRSRYLEHTPTPDTEVVNLLTTQRAVDEDALRSESRRRIGSQDVLQA